MFELADDDEMSKRLPQAERFDELVRLTGEYRPLFVSDEATLYDIQLEDDQWVIDRVRAEYGVNITIDDFRLPIWSLLDRLESPPT